MRSDNQGIWGSFLLLLLYLHLCWSSILTYMLALLFFLWPYHLWFIALSCSDAGVIILLSLMAIQSTVALLSLNDQYGCNSVCTTVFVDGKLWSMAFAKALRCSSFSFLISSAVLQSGIPVHDSIVLMVMHNSVISLCLIWGCVQIGNLQKVRIPMCQNFQHIRILNVLEIPHTIISHTLKFPMCWNFPNPDVSESLTWKLMIIGISNVLEWSELLTYWNFPCIQIIWLKVLALSMPEF